MFNLTEKELEQKDALNTTKEIKQQPELWKETLANYKAKKNDIDAFIDNIKKIMKDSELFLQEQEHLLTWEKRSHLI